MRRTGETRMSSRRIDGASRSDASLVTVPLATGFWRHFGPGLLWAAAAVGVSHLVQSTRAGASAGLALTGVILLALLLKYPFFEYGARYAAATGTSLVEGYRRIGRWALWLYLVITLITSLIIVSVIVLFTGYLLLYVLDLRWSLPVAGAVVYLSCAALLWIGRFRLLDITIKAVVVVLSVSTVMAALLVLPSVDWGTFALWPMIDGELVVPFLFILALMGWMPSAVDVSVWSSLWTLAKNRETGVATTVRNARIDFTVGYIGTGVLAFAFLVLGAGAMHGAGETFSPQGAVFATQLVGLYAQALGEWMRPVVLIAVLTTMFSTALTVIDGFPRAIAHTAMVIRGTGTERARPEIGSLYWGAMILLGITTVVVLGGFAGNLTSMVDIATTVSFVTAPVLGWLNLKAVRSSAVAREHRPGPGLLILSYLGLVLLGGTALFYMVTLPG
jgi:Mn2+/Fe2+ NRAMP family transporter